MGMRDRRYYIASIVLALLIVAFSALLYVLR